MTAGLRGASAATIRLWLVAAAAIQGCRWEEAAERIPSLGPPVRVQVLSDQSGSVRIRAQSAVRILTIPDLILRFDGTLPAPAEIIAERDGFSIAGVFYPSPVRLVSKSRHPLTLKVPDRPGTPGGARAYRGSLDLFNLSGRIRVINEVSMEEYLAGVVGGEMPGSYPPATLESQAIASRTYALYHLHASPRRSLSEGFATTPSFQVYAGFSGENPPARRAVQATMGWVLTFQGKLFPAYYHSTCGGNTTSAALVFGELDIPPLRGVSCDGCVGSSYFRWALNVTLREIEDCLRPWAEAQRIALGEIRELEGVEPLPGGYLRYIRVKHSGGSFEIRADRFREKLLRGGLSGLRSTSFEVGPGPQPSVVTFRGAGWGHGVGLCQHGAARKGQGAAPGEVLAHYFPESELKKLY